MRLRESFSRKNFAGLGDVLCDLGAEGVEGREFLLGAEELAEGDFEVFAVDGFVEVEEMHLEDALAAGVFDRRADADVHDAGQRLRAAPGFDGIDAVGRKLLVVGAEICRGKAEGFPDVIALDDGAEDRELAAEQPSGVIQIAIFHRAANERAADDFAIHFHRRHTDFGEAKLCAELFEEREVAGAAFAKRPLEADADFAQRPRSRDQGADEVGGFSRGEGLVEWDEENVRDAEAADELEFVRRGGEKSRRLFRSQHADGMRVEGDGDGSAAVLLCVVECAAKHGLMAQMHAVEDADGEEEWAGKRGEAGDGAECGHGKIRNPKSEIRNKFEQLEIRKMEMDARTAVFLHFSRFEFVSDFGFRISIFSHHAPRMRETVGRLRMRFSISRGSSVLISSTVTECSSVNLPLFVRRSDLRCAPQPSSLPMSKA